MLSGRKCRRSYEDHFQIMRRVCGLCGRFPKVVEVKWFVCIISFSRGLFF